MKERLYKAVVIISAEGWFNAKENVSKKWHHYKCLGASSMSHEKSWLCDRCDSRRRITPNPISSNDLDDDRPRPQSHSDDISKFRSHSLLDLYALRREGQDDLLRRTANRRRPGGRSVSPVSSPATS